MNTDRQLVIDTAALAVQDHPTSHGPMIVPTAATPVAYYAEGRAARHGKRIPVFEGR